MAKTPVAIVQEYCNKKEVVPHYELIVNGIGTHNPVFQYQLAIEITNPNIHNLYTLGEGKSKKEAKHAAAKAAMLRLQIKPSVPDNKLALPYQGAGKENNVGQLATICADHMLSNPQYVLISEVGLPHEKSFTIECNVGNLKVTGCSQTKQQAKHLSASKMIKKIQEVIGTDITDTQHALKKSKTDEADEKVKQRFIKRKLKSKKMNENFELLINDYHNNNNVLCNLNESYLPELQNYLHCSSDSEKLMNKLLENSFRAITYNFHRSCKNNSNLVLCFCELEPAPYLVALGSGCDEKEAKLQATHKMLNILKSFM